MADTNLLTVVNSKRSIDGAQLTERISRLGSIAVGPRLDTSVLDALSSNTFTRSTEVNRLLDGIQALFEPRDVTASIPRHALTQVFDRAVFPDGVRGAIGDSLQQLLADSGLASKLKSFDYGFRGFTGLDFTPRIVERPMQLQSRPRRRYVDEVDEFLHQVRPDLVGKRRGTTEDLHRSSDPISQAACSGAELISHLFRTLVTDDEVRNQMGGSPARRPAWKDRLLLLHAKYNLDTEAYAEIEHGVLVTRSRLEDIKHDTHLHNRADLMVELAHLERLLLVTARAVTL